MREFKFRALVPVNSDEPKTMHYFNLAFVDDLNRLSYADFDIRHLMQYTGLKDKYGKELYEGDLVSVGGSNPIEIKFGISRHVAHGHGDCTETIVAGFELGYWGRENDLLYLGNIYENKELLTKNI